MDAFRIDRRPADPAGEDPCSICRGSMTRHAWRVFYHPLGGYLAAALCSPRCAAQAALRVEREVERQVRAWYPATEEVEVEVPAAAACR